MRKLHNIDCDKAKGFFLKAENYCTLDLPAYFDFSYSLTNAENILKTNTFDDCAQGPKKIYDIDDVNYMFFSNKDGNYAWRPVEIIHPIVYVDLVNTITEKNNWSLLRNRFIEFKKDRKIECCSDTIINSKNKKQKASNINSYWKKYEQRSIELALKFSYIINTDISGCYENIYTHAIAWAIHEKSFAKNNKKNNNLLGNKIDKKIRDMRYGQTNGIPQGSAMMDFIAEIVLGYVDKELSIKIKTENIKDFQILRYRDDYRIFTNNREDSNNILKILSELLSEFNFKLNTQKTIFSDDIILKSIKQDKLNWLNIKHSFDNETNIQKKLLILKLATDDFKNCGTLKSVLTTLYETTLNNLSDSQKKEIKQNISQIISILADIWENNASAYAQIAAVISKLLSLIPKYKKEEIINKLIRKFKSIPNNAYFEIWLQRIMIKTITYKKFNSKLATIVYTPNTIIWNNTWLTPTIIFMPNIISDSAIENVNTIITFEEIEVFKHKAHYCEY